MQQTNFANTPAKDLLELLCKERIEQYYHYQVECDKEYTTINFYIKDPMLSVSHQASSQNVLAAG